MLFVQSTVKRIVYDRKNIIMYHNNLEKTYHLILEKLADERDQLSRNVAVENEYYAWLTYVIENMNSSIYSDFTIEWYLATMKIANGYHSDYSLNRWRGK